MAKQMPSRALSAGLQALLLLIAITRLFLPNVTGRRRHRRRRQHHWSCHGCGKWACRELAWRVLLIMLAVAAIADTSRTDTGRRW